MPIMPIVDLVDTVEITAIMAIMAIMTVHIWIYSYSSLVDNVYSATMSIIQVS